jgi:ABC-2 type transport system permease protein
MLAYRLRYFTGILTYFLFVSVHYFIWNAVYHQSGSSGDMVINGYTLSEMVTYVSVGWIARSLYFSNIDEVIDDMVRSGEIGIYLIRPVNFQIMLFAQAIGESLFRLIFFTFPIGLVLWLCFPIALPVSGSAMVFFLLALLIGFFILAEMNFIIGLLAFRFKSIEGLMRAKYYLVQLLSGLLIPLSFFPPALEKILDYLPFQAISYTPLQFYLGKIPAQQIATVFSVQLAWMFSLFVIGGLMSKKAFSRLSIQGG